MKRILFGRAGLTRAQLHPVHRFARYAYTFLHAKLSGEDWAEYKRRWIR